MADILQFRKHKTPLEQLIDLVGSEFKHFTHYHEMANYHETVHHTCTYKGVTMTVRIHRGETCGLCGEKI